MGKLRTVVVQSSRRTRADRATCRFPDGYDQGRGGVHVSDAETSNMCVLELFVASGPILTV